MRLTPTQLKPVRVLAARAGGQQRQEDLCAIFLYFRFTSGFIFNKIVALSISVLLRATRLNSSRRRDLSGKVPEQFQI